MCKPIHNTKESFIASIVLISAQFRYGLHFSFENCLLLPTKKQYSLTEKKLSVLCSFFVFLAKDYEVQQRKMRKLVEEADSLCSKNDLKEAISCLEKGFSSFSIPSIRIKATLKMLEYLWKAWQNQCSEADNGKYDLIA